MKTSAKVFPTNLRLIGPTGEVSYQLDPSGSDHATVEFISSLVCCAEPSVFVEAGTYRGATTLAVALTLLRNGIAGHIWTAETNSESLDTAVDAAKTIGVDQYITFYHGKYEDMLADFPWPIDFAYIDGGERLPMIEMTLPKLSRYGLIVVDDMMPGMWGDKEAQKKAISYLDVYLPYHRGIGIIQKAKA